MHLRSHELGSLLDAAAATGSGSVLVIGEPGSGKSWLLERLGDELADADDAPLVLTADGHAAEVHLPFATLHQLLEPLLDLLGRLAEPQRIALAGALALEATGPQEQFAVALGAKALLVQAAAQASGRRVVLVVDDLHWVDASSRQVLGFLARRLGGTAVTLVCATRPPGRGAEATATSVAAGPGDPADASDPVDASDSADASDPADPGAATEPTDLADLFSAFEQRMPLAPFDDAQSRELLRQRYPELGTIAARRVLGLAGGLPLALVQLPAELDPSQRRDEEPLPEPLPTGDRLERLYATRLTALDDAATRAALAVCLAPLRRDEAEQALRLMGLDTSALDVPQRLGLVEYRGGRFAPSHPTLAPVLLRTSTHAQQVAVHRALATVFADDVERLAQHVWAEQGVDADREAAVLAAAAQGASARLAYAEAAEFWERAVAVDPDRAEALEWQAAAFEAYTHIGARAPALRLVDALMASSEDPVQLARWQIARLRLGFWTDLDRSLDDRTIEIAAAAAARDPEVAAELVVTHALELAVFGEFHAGAEVLERARAGGSIEASRADEAPSLIDELIRVMRADDVGVDIATWRERMLRAEPGAASGAFPMISLLLAWLGRVDDALALGAHFDELAARMNVLGPRSTTLAIEAVTGVVVGRWDAADARFAECVQFCIDTGTLGPLSYMRLRHAWLLAARGDAAEALALCELAVPDPERTTPLFRHMMLCVMGLARLSAGELTEAIAALADAAELEERAGIVQPGYSSRFGDWFEASWRSRQADAAGLTDALARFEGRIHSPDNPAVAIALRCHALLAPPGEIDAAFTTAIAAQEPAFDPYQGARTRLLYGVRLRRERRKADARGPLQEAADLFTRLGAFAWAAQARSELAACGERRPVQTPGDPLARLTSRENEIARLVAEGLTSAAAAERLSVSVRTVDSHLASIYRKLGVHDRAAVAELIGD
jgi:DNA-binding CsgD family transcriptional regulator